MSASRGPFRFKPGTNLGSETAELDPYFANCFVDTAAFHHVADFNDQRCVLVGRSGTGKTAILRRIEETREHVIIIRPQALALDSLQRNDLLRTLKRSGVHLEVFFQSLWRHVFVIELLRHFVPITQDRRSAIRQILDRVAGREPKRAPELNQAASYLENLEPAFFQGVTDRIQEITRKFEQNLRAKLHVDIPWVEFFSVGAEKSRAKSSEVTERLQIAQEAVASERVYQLETIVDILDEHVVSDDMKKTFILIDDLDLNWASDDIVDELLRALMLEVFQFAKRVRRCKIVVALRDNLLHQVESGHTGRGYYQREKLETQRIRSLWSENELKELIERRVNFATGKIYSLKELTLDDILPKSTRTRKSGFDFLTERCSFRPRDFIHYLNMCMSENNAKFPLSHAALEKVEPRFAEWRYASMVEEWSANYPGISEFGRILLRGRPASFPLSDWSGELLLNAAASVESYPWATELAAAFDAGGASALACSSATVLYECGFVGVRVTPAAGERFSFTDTPSLEVDELQDEARIIVHRGLRRYLSPRS